MNRITVKAIENEVNKIYKESRLLKRNFHGGLNRLERELENSNYSIYLDMYRNVIVYNSKSKKYHTIYTSLQYSYLV